MRVLVVLPAAKGVYPVEAEQRRVDVVSAYSSPDVEIAVGFPAQEFGDAIGVPVLEGMGCAVAMAQAWIRLGAQHS